MIDAIRGCRRSAWIAVALAMASSILFVVLVSYLPTAILAGAAHDDAWFWLRARSIATGSWMGGYDQYTLMKGSGYSLFLAVGHALGLSVTTSQALLYSGACLLLGAAVHRASGRLWLSLLLVLAMQWHPMALTWGRVVRDNISAAQTLLVLGCMVQAFFVAHSRRGRWFWAAASGWTLAWFWTTREDGIWLFPGLAILLLARWWQVRRDPEGRRCLAAGGALMASVFGLWLGLVASANWIKYGEFATVDMKESAFEDALSALHRVHVGEVVPYVPVPQKVREAVYDVSPAFARLRPHLEGTGKYWTKPGCSIYPQTCGDYAGGWFMWELRDAVASVGAYASAPAADAFYRALADEVGRACDEGRLTCKRNLVPLMPPATDAQWMTLPARLRQAAAVLVWANVREERVASHVDHPRAGEMWDFVGRPRVPDDPDALGDWVIGWFHDPRGGWILGRCASHARTIAIERRPSPDIAAHFDDPRANESRFLFKLPSARGCAIEAASGEGAVELAEVTPDKRYFTFGAGQLHLDGTGPGISPGAAGTPAAVGAIKRVVGGIYEAVLPWLSGAGLLAFLWASARALAMRDFSVLLALAAAAWCSVAGRSVLLALVDMSSFPAVNAQYLQPAFPLLLLAALVSLALLRDRGDARQIGPRE